MNCLLVCARYFSPFVHIIYNHYDVLNTSNISLNHKFSVIKLAKKKKNNCPINNEFLFTFPNYKPTIILNVLTMINLSCGRLELTTLTESDKWKTQQNQHSHTSHQQLIITFDLYIRISKIIFFPL